MVKRFGPPEPIEGVQIIAEPSQFRPSGDDRRVVGVFNPGVTTIVEDGIEKTLLMARKAEQFEERVTHNPADNVILAPHIPVQNRPDSHFTIEYDEFPVKELKPQSVSHKDILLPNGTHRLRHISYPVLCVLDEEGNIVRERVEDPSGLSPCYEHERFGVEDIRITRMDEGEEIMYGEDRFRYILTYVPGPHRTHRVSTAFALTNDFKTFQRVAPSPDETPRTIIPEKDVVFFPRRIEKRGMHGKSSERFCKLTRPSAFYSVSRPDICLAYGAEVIEGGPSYRLVESDKSVRSGMGSSGPGPAPIEVDGMWLVFYHQVENLAIGPVYRTALLGLDLREPWRVLHTSEPFIQPNQHDRGSRAYTPNVTYVMGAELRNNGETIEVISGENDESISRRCFRTEDIVRFLKAG